MTAPLAARLLDRVSDAGVMYHRLVLTVGPAGSGKTEAFTDLAAAHGWPCINVNLKLAERLLDLTQKQRAVRVAGLLDDIVKATSAEVVLLDNIEMLFAVELAQDPLRLLQGLSRNRTIVASWPGTFDGRVLAYAEPGHREFKKYSTPQAVIVNAHEPRPLDVFGFSEKTL
ncbi:BREX-3 system P-loop-containing protein BrxF [Polyangium mundeleinium]|uniref:BREX-3 system P-loop-containing protein BrxF n=1 Tax=Polyangium mundeleinium TaxID=2995306 RepID=A0ABT5EHK5_9BACT|nr:BREX-3 system P-loop-containing protein BrxF [Polyangium mundeleinium]MDC0740857.1 BREX-3 system P-loop-containing protein BrxF [Polyangium mundeleinium]